MRRSPLGMSLVGGVLAVVACCLGGCRPFGGAASQAATTAAPLSGRAVEKTIDDKLPPQLHGVHRAGAAKCPATIKPGSGGDDDCTMLVDGQSVRVKVAAAGSGYRVSLDQAVVSAAVLERNLARTYQQKFTFSCGAAGVRVVDPGDKIECQGTPAGGGPVKLFDVTIQDTSGTYSAAPHTP